MRRTRRFAPMLAGGLFLLAVLPYDTAPQASAAVADRHARVEPDPSPRPFGAECRTNVSGSQVVAYCHNPYPETDRVRLHVECAEWWDIDTDAKEVEVGPAMTVRLSGRCWKEIGSVWVSHSPA
ncbi:hypothetical protein P8605_41720 [Streptomyces sp. T-3]|nr:hypothetical protein [Streptomyces sp. T-3]